MQLPVPGPAAPQGAVWRPLPYGGEPGEGETGRGTWLVHTGLQVKADDGGAPGQEAEREGGAVVERSVQRFGLVPDGENNPSLRYQWIGRQRRLVRRGLLTTR